MWLKSCKSCLTFIQANFLISLLQRLNQLVHVALKPQHLVLPMVLLTLAVLQYVVQVMASPGETPACTQRQAMADVQERQAWLFPKTETQQLLGRYVVLVKRQEEIAKEQIEIVREMEEIHAELVDILPKRNENTRVYNLFQPFVDAKKLSVCFSSIFKKFFGILPTEKLEGDYNKQIDLIAYFFIIVEWEELGSYIFKEKCKKPFFEYINKNVLKGELGVTERTFYNRLTCTMDDFRKKLSKEPVSSKFKNECWKNDFFIKDFLKVLRIFHGTEYYKELEMRKHA